jgi:pSer/pThr/pTyr-binding forkhead associated (FHA) protein
VPVASAAPEPKPKPPLAPSALTGFLISYDANPSGDFWPLTGGRHTVGRANSGDSVAIPLADATISSRHAVLEVDALAGKVLVEDTGSTNGTFVNDEHVGFSGRRDLRDGDKLRLGGFTTIVKVIARG